MLCVRKAPRYEYHVLIDPLQDLRCCSSQPLDISRLSARPPCDFAKLLHMLPSLQTPALTLSGIVIKGALTRASHCWGSISCRVLGIRAGLVRLGSRASSLCGAQALLQLCAACLCGCKGHHGTVLARRAQLQSSCLCALLGCCDLPELCLHLKQTFDRHYLYQQEAHYPS